VHELLLQDLILLGGERAWEPLRGVGNVLATDEVGEERKLLGPSQFGEDGAKGDEQVDIVGRRERRRQGAQAGHPAEEMGFTAQLVQGIHLGVMGAEIAEEVADGAAIVTRSAEAERRTEGIDRTIEERS
jgi:hypothetical protein